MNKSKKSLLLVAAMTVLLTQTDMLAMQRATLTIKEQAEFAEMLREMSAETFQNDILAHPERFFPDELYLIAQEEIKRKTGLPR